MPRSVRFVVMRLGWLRVGPTVGVFLLAQGVALMMALVQLDAMVDWPATWTAVAATPVWWRGAGLALLIALQGLGERRVIRRVWLASHAVLLRQPLSRIDLGIAAYALLGLLASPLAVIGGMATGSLATAATWGLLGALGVALWAGPRPGAAVLGTLGLGALAAVAELHVVAAALAWLGALRLGTPVLGRLTREWAEEATAAPSWGLGRPRTPLLALLRRDVLLLGRTAPRQLVGPLLLAGGLAAVITLARRNNPDPGGIVAGAGLVGLALAGVVAHGGVTAVVQRLGARFDPPQWPVRARLRAGAVVLLAAGLTFPSWAVAAAGGLPALDVVEQLGQLAVWWGLAGAVAWTVVRRRGQANLGAFLWWTLAIVGVCFVRPAAGVAVGLGALGLTGWASTRQIERDRRSR